MQLLSQGTSETLLGIGLNWKHKPYKSLGPKDWSVNLIFSSKHTILLKVNLVFILHDNQVYVVTFVCTCCVNICLIFELVPTYVE